MEVVGGAAVTPDRAGKAVCRGATRAAAKLVVEFSCEAMEADAVVSVVCTLNDTTEPADWRRRRSAAVPVMATEAAETLRFAAMLAASDAFWALDSGPVTPARDSVDEKVVCVWLTKPTGLGVQDEEPA